MELVKKAVWNLDVTIDWAGNIPVSINLSLLDSVWIRYLTMLREDDTQRSHRHLEGFGHFPISTAANPPTVHSVDQSSG